MINAINWHVNGFPKLLFLDENTDRVKKFRPYLVQWSFTICSTLCPLAANIDSHASAAQKPSFSLQTIIVIDKKWVLFSRAHDLIEYYKHHISF